jgi:hypothetical protein
MHAQQVGFSGVLLFGSVRGSSGLVEPWGSRPQCRVYTTPPPTPPTPPIHTRKQQSALKTAKTAVSVR